MSALVLTLAFLVGLALLAFGSWLAYEPAGFVVGGLVLVLVPVFYVRGGQA